MIIHLQSKKQKVKAALTALSGWIDHSKEIHTPCIYMETIAHTTRCHGIVFL